MAPRVAVAMSIYKSDNVQYLQQALDSIFQQSYLDLTIFLCIDGPIPKNLREKIDGYVDLYNNLQLVTLQHNQGLANALNTLIDVIVNEGTFEYIARMDSDDISYLDRFEKQIAFLHENTNVDVCGTFCEEFGASYALPKKSLPILHEDLLEFSISRCPFIHPSVMFRCNVFSDGIRYPTNTKLTEDMALWFILLKNGYVFGNVDEALIKYRLNENTIIRRKGFNKGLSEFKLRMAFMFSLRKFSIKNTVLITSRLFFHILPKSVLKLAYIYFR